MTNCKPFLSIILPCFNEGAILANTLNTLLSYLENKSEKYNSEVLIINDGSKDNTRQIAEDFCRRIKSIRLINHPINMNLGHALQTGFKNSRGDVIVVLDVDLSYSVDLIEQLVDTLMINYCDVVVASPYMPGGKTTGIPFNRRIMSLWVNKFMRVAAQDKYFTYTSMVRAYRSSFIKNLNLKTKDYEISPEIMYKAMILRASVIEIPAHLDWTEQNKYKGQRTSGMRVIRGFLSGIMSAFIFRPYMFFLAVGIFLMLISLVELITLLLDTLAYLRNMVPDTSVSFSDGLAVQWANNPQTFIIGGVTFLAAIQLLSLSFISLQNKRYFEELFHLGTTLTRKIDKNENNILDENIK